jgi:hypothetical protein
MHPYVLGELGRLRHEELLHDAEQARRARSARPRRDAGAGRWAGVKAAVGRRMVATGARLLETGLPNTR